MKFSARELHLLSSLFNELLDTREKDAAEENQKKQTIEAGVFDKMGSAMTGDMRDASTGPAKPEPSDIDGRDFKLSDLLTELECRFRCTVGRQSSYVFHGLADTSFEHCFYGAWLWGVEVNGKMTPQEAAQQLLYYTAKQFRSLYLAGARQIIWRKASPHMELKLYSGGHRASDLVKLYARFVALDKEGVPCAMPDICPDGGEPSILDLREFMAELNVQQRASR